MIRPHIHITVSNLDTSIAYYTDLLGVGPDRRAADYAQWRLERPALNLALSLGDGPKGVSHVGLDFATADALETHIADQPGQANPETCCYARSDKAWRTDPDGVSWELFHTRERLTPPAPEASEPNPARCCG